MSLTSYQAAPPRDPLRAIFTLARVLARGFANYLLRRKQPVSNDPAHEPADHVQGSGIIGKHYGQIPGPARAIPDSLHHHLHRTSAGTIYKCEFPFFAIEPH